jgi:hypothetical protein
MRGTHFDHDRAAGGFDIPERANARVLFQCNGWQNPHDADQATVAEHTRVSIKVILCARFPITLCPA